MENNRPAEITIEDWEKTPAAVQGYIAKQEAAIKDARERLGQNSQNSSRPPSSDFPEQKGKKSKKKRTATQRKAGGQPGHKRHKRELTPVEDVDEVVPVKPEICRHCGAGLAGEDSQPHRHQVTEIPPIAY